MRSLPVMMLEHLLHPLSRRFWAHTVTPASAAIADRCGLAIR